MYEFAPKCLCAAALGLLALGSQNTGVGVETVSGIIKDATTCVETIEGAFDSAGTNNDQPFLCSLPDSLSVVAEDPLESGLPIAVGAISTTFGISMLTTLHQTNLKRRGFRFTPRVSR